MERHMISNVSIKCSGEERIARHIMVVGSIYGMNFVGGLITDEVKVGTSEWLIRRQRHYDRLGADYKLSINPFSSETMELHRAIVAEIDKLPVSEGGRVDRASEAGKAGGLLAVVVQPSDRCCLNFGCENPEYCNSLGLSCGDPR